MTLKKKFILITLIVFLAIFSFSLDAFSQDNNNDDNYNIDELNNDGNSNTDELNNDNDDNFDDFNDLDDLSDDLDDLDNDNLDDSNNDEEENDFSFSIGGHVKTNFHFNLSENTENDEYGDITFDRLGVGLQLRFDAYLGYFGYFYSEINMDYNHSLRDPNSNITDVKLSMGETYLDLYISNFFTIRAGNQKIIWGKADGLSVPTDNINPVNYGISSSELDDLKMPVIAMAFDFYFSDQKLELVWIPVFQPAILPDEFNDNMLSMINNVNYPYNSGFSINNSEIGIQLSGIFSIFSYGVSFLYAWDDMFDFDVVDPMTGNINLEYNRVMIPGLDFDIAIKDVLLKASVALFITEDWDGVKDTVKNPYIKYIIGLDWTMFGIASTFQLGQNIVINYTEPTPTDLSTGTIDNDIFIYGIGQLDKIKYTALFNGQKSFLTGNALTIAGRFQFAANEVFDNLEFILNLDVTYEPVDSVSLSCDFIYMIRKEFINYDPMADGLELAYKNTFNLRFEFKYSF